MNAPFSRILSLVALFAAALANLFAAEKAYDVTGTVRRELTDGRVTIAHREIPGFMAAMTMSFVVTDAKEAASLKPGDDVRFRLRQIDDDFVADRFVVTGRSAEAASPSPARSKIARLKPGSDLPAIQLIDEQSRPVTRETLRGQYTIATFIFTRCPVPEYCPAMALQFASLQRRLAARPANAAPVRLLSITLDPDFDRPDILTAYGKAVGARPEIWNFATGTKAEIETLSRAFSVFTERNGVTLDHTLCTALLGPDGKIVEIWRGNAWKVDEVVETLAKH